MVFVGIDWSEKSHRVVILDDDGQQLETRRIEHSHLGLQELGSILRAHASPAEVFIAVEMHRGLLLDWLVQQDCRVYGINPKSAERARDRFSPAGLKDDERDAWCLAEALPGGRRAAERRGHGPVSTLLSYLYPLTVNQ